MTTALDPRRELERLLGADAVAARAVAGRELAEARPASEDELVETLRLAAREGWRVLPLGLGSKLDWRPVEGPLDLALSSARLAGVVAYEPGDGTLTARAGTTLAELERVVADGGHALTPWVSRPEEATLGGALSAGQSGLDRTRFGPSRHHVLGARAALADGSVARSGGRLVKNVTGFDLHRLWCGAHGTLGVLVEATLRLFAAPEARALALWRAQDGLALLDAARALATAPLRPFALALSLDEAGRGELALALAGREAVLDEELERARAVYPGAEVLRGAAAERALDALRSRERDAAGAWPTRRIGCRRSVLDARVRALLPGARRLLVQPALAEVAIWSADPGAGSARSIEERGASAQALEIRLRRSFDPNGLFAERQGLAVR